jgi:putative SOS response-associated peptidase YedK
VAGAVQERRCLIPAGGFYEWPEDKMKSKQPYVLSLADYNLFAFAGIWDACKDKDGHWVQSFAMVTTEANELMSTFHSRMPVILHSRDYDRWLAREATDQPPLDVLRAFESDQMEMSPANPLVGKVRNNGPEMLNNA